MTEYGLIANLLAAPIVSLLIMPMALLQRRPLAAR
jgi:Flp pilus assembly pilin Flp